MNEENENITTQQEQDDLQYKRLELDKSIFESFDSFSEFFRVVDTRSEHSWSRHSRKSTDGWAGPQTYDEIKEGIFHGLDIDASQFKEKILEEAKIQGWNRVKSGIAKPAVVGSSPIVPRALQNLPKSMRRREVKPTKGKIVNILYDVSVSCNISESQIERYGARVLALIYQLESLGYRVRLDLLTAFTSSSQKYGYFGMIKLKDEGQQLNIRKTAAALTSAAIERKVMFDWYERLPDAEYFSGYGYPLSKCPPLIEKVKTEFFRKDSAFYVHYGTDLQKEFSKQLSYSDLEDIER